MEQKTQIIAEWKNSNLDRLSEIKLNNPELYSAINATLSFLNKKVSGTPLPEEKIEVTNVEITTTEPKLPYIEISNGNKLELYDYFIIPPLSLDANGLPIELNGFVLTNPVQVIDIGLNTLTSKYFDFETRTITVEKQQISPFQAAFRLNAYSKIEMNNVFPVGKEFLVSPVTGLSLQNCKVVAVLKAEPMEKYIYLLREELNQSYFFKNQDELIEADLAKDANIQFDKGISKIDSQQDLAEIVSFKMAKGWRKGQLFYVKDVNPQIKRFLSAEERIVGGENVIIINYEFYGISSKKWLDSTISTKDKVIIFPISEMPDFEMDDRVIYLGPPKVEAKVTFLSFDSDNQTFKYHLNINKIVGKDMLKPNPYKYSNQSTQPLQINTPAMTSDDTDDLGDLLDEIDNLEI